jgi:hypothetical protein
MELEAGRAAEVVSPLLQFSGFHDTMVKYCKYHGFSQKKIDESWPLCYSNWANGRA